MELTGACWTILEEEPREGNESIATFWSSCIASWFSWELRGSTASLLGTGVRVEGRLAKESELDFVVSLRQDEGWPSLGAGDGVAEALEKKPRILFCFPADDDMAVPFLATEGVLAGVCLWGSGLLTMAGECYSSMVAEYKREEKSHLSGQIN